MNEPAAFGTNEERPWYFDYADHPNITSLRCPLTGNDSHYDSPPFKTFNVYAYGDNAHVSLIIKHSTTVGNSSLR